MLKKAIYIEAYDRCFPSEVHLVLESMVGLVSYPSSTTMVHDRDHDDPTMLSSIKMGPQ